MNILPRLTCLRLEGLAAEPYSHLSLPWEGVLVRTGPRGGHCPLDVPGPPPRWCTPSLPPGLDYPQALHQAPFGHRPWDHFEFLH